MGWVGLWVQSFHSAMGWVRLGQSFGGLGWVEAIGPTDNSACASGGDIPIDDVESTMTSSTFLRLVLVCSDVSLSAKSIAWRHSSRLGNDQ